MGGALAWDISTKPPSDSSLNPTHRSVSAGKFEQLRNAGQLKLYCFIGASQPSLTASQVLRQGYTGVSRQTGAKREQRKICTSLWQLRRMRGVQWEAVVVVWLMRFLLKNKFLGFFKMYLEITNSKTVFSFFLWNNINWILNLKIKNLNLFIQNSLKKNPSTPQKPPQTLIQNLPESVVLKEVRKTHDPVVYVSAQTHVAWNVDTPWNSSENALPAPLLPPSWCWWQGGEGVVDGWVLVVRRRRCG